MLLLFIISNSNTHSTAGGKEYSLVIKVMKYSFLLPFSCQANEPAGLNVRRHAAFITAATVA